MIESTDQTFYLLVCRDCGDDDGTLVMPFESAQARGSWAARHRQATGHNRWFVEDEIRPREGFEG
jgi:hypothetical protein